MRLSGIRRFAHTALFVAVAHYSLWAQTPKPSVEIDCACTDPLSVHVERYIHYQVDDQYHVAPRAPIRISLESAIPSGSSGYPTSAALSIAITQNGKLLDHWAVYCRNDELVECSKNTSQNVLRTLKTAIATTENVEQPNRPTPAPRLHTGDELEPSSGASGNGVLILTCEANMDSIVKVVDEKIHATIRTVYVRANDTVKITNLAPGSYSVKVAQGSTFENKDSAFGKQTSFFQFPHPYTFTETELSDRIRYDEITLTLNSVTGGNVKPVPITAAEFWNDNPVHQTY